MLLQIKVYLIGFLYFCGALFMILFPPRNFKQSGHQLRTLRSADIKQRFNNYISYNEMVSAAHKLANEDPEVVKLETLTPQTYGNRSLLALELRSDKGPRKPGILIVGALNGMAWGAASAILDLAERLIHDANYQLPFFNDYDWYLIPMGNPDGITFTQELSSLPPIDVKEWCSNETAAKNHRPSEWHKNVDKAGDNHKCFGTHINRNFPYHWQDDVTKTPDRCSQFYPGDTHFSAAEARAIRKYVDKLGDDVSMAIHLHASFIPKKDRLLYPWRYARKSISNYATLQAIGEYAARQARFPDGRLYEVHQSSSDADGRVAGSMEDYLAGVVAIEQVYIIKLYHQAYPNFTDRKHLELYMKQASTTILSLVRGWRLGNVYNTLSFFGRIIEF